jgi:hypothetical protein
MFRGAFTAIRDAVRKLFRPPIPKSLAQIKPTPGPDRDRPKMVKEGVSMHQWAHGKIVRYSDRSYYCEPDSGRFLRLKPGESVQGRLSRLAHGNYDRWTARRGRLAASRG